MSIMKRNIRDNQRGMAKTTLVLVIIGVMIVSGLSYAGYSTWVDDGDGESSVKKVETGDTVSCDYIGSFDDGRVFDTNIKEVAYNNISYPKSVQYQTRSSSGYVPYEFTVGQGDTIQGWQDAVIGMTEGQTKVVRISPEDAYGEKEPEKIRTANISFEVPLYKKMSNIVFNDLYSGVVPVVGSLFMHLEYRWPCQVAWVDDDSGLLMYKNMPEVNGVYLIDEDYDWEIKVDSIDHSGGEEGTIKVSYLITDADEDRKMFEEEDGRQFIVRDVNLDEGTFVKDYNREVRGETLVFKITVKSITKNEDE